MHHTWIIWEAQDLDEVAQWFQSVNPVLFDIKIDVFATVKKNKFSGKESEIYNLTWHIS